MPAAGLGRLVIATERGNGAPDDISVSLVRQDGLDTEQVQEQNLA